MSLYASAVAAAAIPPLQKFDVFLSFKGEDTRCNFTSHLHTALCGDKIETYISDRLEKPKLSVNILSKDYASSKLCLAEFVHILLCKKNVDILYSKVWSTSLRRPTRCNMTSSNVMGPYLFRAELNKQLNKKKYDYTTLAECFDVADDLTDWDDKTQKKISNQDHTKSSDRKGGHKDKQALFKPTKYTTLNTTMNNILHNIKDKPYLKRLKPLPNHLAKKKPNEYCSFHQCNDHTTWSFHTLRANIEELLNQGNCREFVKSKAIKEKPADKERPRQIRTTRAHC
ncbi:hypothetical protein DVH24_034658 [Malus domestica]|uniref:TIR domain-containing protein n=1 Tax=Malus domestica TaxID=3750 RepID=A0A498IWP6_MALDO|nr:hypothetical protein DVH24_034658 [Malus domestica]